MFKSTLNLTLVTALFIAGASSAFAQDSAKDQEGKLIAVLKSDAGQKEKADACRELGRVGTSDAVPVLAALLTDEKLSHPARYGLETIPSPAVNEALRAALEKVKGRLLAGVIGSLGVRKDAQAVQPIAKFLQDADADVAQAAARALGKIGTAEAASAIEAALGNAPSGNKLAFCEGLFRCAEVFAAAGQRDQAISIYERLRKVEGLHQVRAGAFRGAVLARQKEGIPMLLEGIRSDDYVLVAAAARTAMEMRDAEVTTALANELGKVPADKQILLTQTLGKRGDAEALPALYAAAKSGPKAVRIAAIRAIPEIGKAGSAETLIGLLKDGEREIAQAAQDALAGLLGAQVDSAVMTMLNGTDNDLRVVATDLVARRRMTAAMPELVKAAGASEPKVRQAALKRMGELGTVQTLPVLTDFLLQAKGADVDAAEQALSSVCTKSANPEACTDPIVSAISKAQPEQKSALLRVLSAIGGNKALTTVRAAVDDTNPEVHNAAVRALGSWESVDAAPHLLALAKSSKDAKEKMLCLRSYLNLASSHTDLPAPQRLEMCKAAADLVQKPEEKKLYLSTLGNISSVEALAAITPYLEDASTKDEAGAAIVTISEKLLRPRNIANVAPKVLPAVEQVAKVTGNADLAQKAKNLLEQAKSKMGARP